MAADAPGVPTRRTARLPSSDLTPSLGPWGFAALAQVLAVLCQRPVTSDEVRDRAVGLGLFRLPAPGETALLTLMAVSRLFLAGYGLPAAADVGTLLALREHHRAGRRVFVALLRGQSGQAGAGLFELHGPPPSADDGDWLLVSEPDRPEVWRLAAATFAADWQAAGQVLIVAARHWDELPGEGTSFFAGCRSPDDTYHWHTAECDTDRAGRVLRF